MCAAKSEVLAEPSGMNTQHSNDVNEGVLRITTGSRGQSGKEGPLDVCLPALRRQGHPFSHYR